MLKNAQKKTPDRKRPGEKHSLLLKEFKLIAYAPYCLECPLIGNALKFFTQSLYVYVNCEMEGADFAFEKSEVEADIVSSVISIKNPLSGTISVVSAGEVIIDEPWAKGKVTVSN